MGTKTVTIRMPEDLATWLSEQGDSMNQTIVELLENVHYSRIYALNELKGKFTTEEWKYFSDILSSTMVTGKLRFFPSVLVASCEDSETFEGSNWGVNLNVLKEKINGLSSSQVEALYFRVESFLAQPGDLEEWANY